jgi:hypothetical protein
MAKQPTPQQQEHSAMEKLQATFKRMREMEPSRFVQYFKEAVMETRDDLGKPWDYVYGSLLDVHRRVIEEPTYGKPMFDMLYNVNQRATTGQKDKLMDEDKQRVAEGPAYQHDYSPDGFYGRSQDKSAEQQHARSRDDDHGMER